MHPRMNMSEAGLCVGLVKFVEGVARVLTRPGHHSMDPKSTSVPIHTWKHIRQTNGQAAG